MVWVVVPAAGSGSRFNSSLPKQYTQVCGRPVLEHCLWRLSAHPLIDGVMVALDRLDHRFVRLQLPPGLEVRRVDGGAQRSDSVLSALLALPDSVKDSDPVLVHDAARPCISSQLLDRLLALADEPAGALLALPCHDTLKRVDPDADMPSAETTVDRRAYWLAQTPQMFPRIALTQALISARQRQITITDESMAMELTGLKPRLVPGAASNRKLTVSEDLPAIEAWLRQHPLPSDYEKS